MAIRDFNKQYKGFQFKIYDYSFKAYKMMPSGRWKMIKYRDRHMDTGKWFKSNDEAWEQAKKYIDDWKPSVKKSK